MFSSIAGIVNALKRGSLHDFLGLAAHWPEPKLLPSPQAVDQRLIEQALERLRKRYPNYVFYVNPWKKKICCLEYPMQRFIASRGYGLYEIHVCLYCGRESAFTRIAFPERL